MSTPRARSCFCLAKARHAQPAVPPLGLGDGAAAAQLGGLERLNAAETAAGASRVPHSRADVDALRTQLSELRLRQLTERAVAAGVTEEQVDEAEDADDHRSALVDLVLARELPPQREQASGDKEAVAIGSAPEHGPHSMRVQLQSLRLKQLRHRAGAEGLDDDAIEDALDGDNPKAALIDLLVEREAARGRTERVLSTLEDSGDDSAAMLSGVLDHAIE
eukprot:COSAG06_NODE_4005_length_4669_cov_393.186652_4_plen_219_part_01